MLTGAVTKVKILGTAKMCEYYNLFPKLCNTFPVKEVHLCSVIFSY